MYSAHLNGKLNRYKIRVREYIDTNAKYLEVKFKSNKQRTIKKRIKVETDEIIFSEDSKKLLNKINLYKSEDLEPKLQTEFSRLTLVHKNKNERLTIDLSIKYSNLKEHCTEFPFLVIAEHIELNRDAFFGWLQVPYQECHVLIDFRMVPEVLFHIDPEDTEVGHPSSIHQYAIINIMFLVVLFQFFCFVINISLEPLDFAKPVDHFRGTEFNALHIYIDRPFNPSAA